MDLNLQDLDVHDIGHWPLLVKGIVTFVVFLFILLMGYSLDTKKQLDSLESNQEEEITLRAEFEEKQKKAANLDAYKVQLALMKASFGALLRQLPEKTQVPALLEDISHQGLAAGLEFRSIRLLPEEEVDFYIEMPIEISVIGTYHQLGEFISNVASLPRIVTLHDFSIHPLTLESKGDQLVMSITAKTYRYNPEGDDEGQKDE